MESAAVCPCDPPAAIGRLHLQYSAPGQHRFPVSVAAPAHLSWASARSRYSRRRCLWKRRWCWSSQVCSAQARRLPACQRQRSASSQRRHSALLRSSCRECMVRMTTIPNDDISKQAPPGATAGAAESSSYSPTPAPAALGMTALSCPFTPAATACALHRDQPSLSAAMPPPKPHTTPAATTLRPILPHTQMPMGVGPLQKPTNQHCSSGTVTTSSASWPTPAAHIAAAGWALHSCSTIQRQQLCLPPMVPDHFNSVRAQLGGPLSQKGVLLPTHFSHVFGNSGLSPKWRPQHHTPPLHGCPLGQDPFPEP